MKNVYGKCVQMRTRFVSYLVRNSLHFCSVFLSEMKVLNVHYFEDHHQHRRWKVVFWGSSSKYSLEYIIVRGSPPMQILERAVIWGSSSKVSTVNIPKTAAGAEYVGAPPCLQAITCVIIYCVALFRTSGKPGISRVQKSDDRSTYWNAKDVL